MPQSSTCCPLKEAKRPEEEAASRVLQIPHKVLWLSKKDHVASVFVWDKPFGPMPLSTARHSTVRRAGHIHCPKPKPHLPPVTLAGRFRFCVPFRVLPTSPPAGVGEIQAAASWAMKDNSINCTGSPGEPATTIMKPGRFRRSRGCFCAGFHLQLHESERSPWPKLLASLSYGDHGEGKTTKEL